MRPTASQLDFTSCRLTGVDSHFSASLSTLSAPKTAEGLQQLLTYGSTGNGLQKVHSRCMCRQMAAFARMMLRAVPAIMSAAAPPERLLFVLKRRMKLLAPGVLWLGLSPKGLLRGEYGLLHEPRGRLMASSASGVVSLKKSPLGLRFSSPSSNLQESQERSNLGLAQRPADAPLETKNDFSCPKLSEFRPDIAYSCKALKGLCLTSKVWEHASRSWRWP